MDTYEEIDNLITKRKAIKLYIRLVGLGGLEPPTFALSEQRSNHLSYKPYSVDINIFTFKNQVKKFSS